MDPAVAVTLATPFASVVAVLLESVAEGPGLGPGKSVAVNVTTTPLRGTPLSLIVTCRGAGKGLPTAPVWGVPVGMTVTVVPRRKWTALLPLRAISVRPSPLKSPTSWEEKPATDVVKADG